jgi:FtsP/CotA-like multicopper oxidase with cupredoxin domain
VSSRPISRRHAITIGGLGVAAVAAGAAGWLSTNATTGGETALSGASGEELAQPPVLSSAARRLAVELTAAPGVRLAGRDTGALGFNGSSPGPTLRVRPGDELAVRLTNRLDHPTNLHTHGLRVSPQNNGDNPFVRIDPGASFDYLYRIPPDHPAGTFWYHPHHHGTVADQLFGGLAGALIVQAAPELDVAQDRVLLVTDTTLTPAGDIAPASPMDKMLGRQGQLVLVNGQHQPAIPADTGTTQRWRIINGCASRVLPLRLVDHQPAQIALDGAFLPTPRITNQVVLAPGNRADLLIRPETPGEFELVADGYDRGSLAMGGMMGQPATSGPVTLATLVVTGPARSTRPLPPSLPTPAPISVPVTRRREITFATGMGGMLGGGSGGGMGMSFTIDGRGFDPGRDDQTVAFGSVEEWTITNTSPMAHPFHLHIWPFTVIAASTPGALSGVPQDVVLVPPRGWVRVQIPFTERPGRGVYHCHILDHEDLGMMATINTTSSP